MIVSISLVMPYYDNAGMLEKHYELWASFPEEIKNRMEVVIVDDGTPTVAAADVPRPEGLPDLKIFRVQEDRPWYQHAARNIGAKEATCQWLYLTDMDHLLPVETWQAMFQYPGAPHHVVYTHLRVDAPSLKPKIKNGKEHPHPNTFLMRKDFYWHLGGYDEDFCGFYGTDGMFRNRLWARAKHSPMRDKIIRYPREVIEDASTRTYPRKEGRTHEEMVRKKTLLKQKIKDGTAETPTVLTMPYEIAYES